MLDIKFIRDNAKAVQENCRNRRADVDIDALLKLDEHRRQKLAKLEDMRAVRNKKSKTKPSQEEIEKMRTLGDEIKSLELAVDALEDEFRAVMLSVPNMTHPDAPIGGEKDFSVLHEWGSPAQFSFEPKDHETLMTAADMLDFERGAKVAGAKFYFVKNSLVRLNMALLNYGMDVAVAHGFTLMETPDIVNNDILDGSGFNPRGQESQIYEIKDHDLSLIGTAEIPVLGYHAGEVLDLSRGPKKYAALSHCFRTEAGAYGKANKGLYRVHQFTKLEMFVFCKPEDSERLHNELMEIEKEIVQGLEIPYRVIDTATGDLGGPAYRKYDIEAWMVMNNGYGEITSASNCTDYQARRLNIRYADGVNTNFVHTLNGTAAALSRLPVAVVENFQTKDGGFEVPKVLKRYWFE